MNLIVRRRAVFLIAVVAALWGFGEVAFGQNFKGDRYGFSPSPPAPLAQVGEGRLENSAPATVPPIGYGQFLSDEFPTPLPPVDDVVPPAMRLASFPNMMTEPLLGDPENPVLLPPVEQPPKPP